MNVFNATETGQVRVFHEIRRQWRKQLVEGNFYAEGEQVVLRLLQSRLKVLTLLISPEYFKRWSDLIESRKDPEATIWIAEKKWMEENTGQKLNQPCLGIGKIPQPPLLKDLIHSDHCCFVGLDGIDHAVNVGAILRNCAAFGARAVVLDETTVHPYSWRSVKASLGGVFQVPVYFSDSLCDFLLTLQKQGIHLMVADPKGSRSIAQMDFSKKCCLIFGNEHRGVSKKILSLNPARVAIPVSGKVDSLNVAAASAIFLYQCRAPALAGIKDRGL